ncbi:MAG TPA: hypothetical protein VG897_18615 [Terriglobales bacterium]|nr:hypothetical protein [Terriglobales bacterium]
MEHKYGALRFVSVLMKIIGALSIIAGILALVNAIYYVVSHHDYTGFGANLIWAVAPILSGIFWWAMAELIHVFIDIEYNTRRGAITERRTITDVAAD